MTPRSILLALAVMLLAACGGGSGPSSGSETRSAASQPPVAAVSVSHASARSGTRVVLDGQLSRNGDGTLSYAWSQRGGPPISLDTVVADGSVAEFEAPQVDADAVVSIALTVTDAAGAQDTASVDVMVTPFAMSLSGTIVAAQGSAIDGDSNDPAAPRLPNDSAAQAQPLASPVNLAGYAAAAGAGSEGAASVAGDTSDFFRVDLIGGQPVTLIVADPEAGDLDLFLYREDGATLLDASMGRDGFERLTAPATGTYLLEVGVFSGASNYNLVLAEVPMPGMTGASRRLSDDFVPGEIVLERHAAAAARAASSVFSAGVRLSSNAAGRPVLARLETGTLRAQSADGYAARAFRAESAVLREKFETLVTLKGVEADSAVRYAEPNFRLVAQAVPNDPFYGLQWHYRMIDLPAAWELTQGHTAVTVAVVDTGILAAHPDLAGQLVPGYDFVADVTRANDGDGPDPDPEDPGDGESASGGFFHGTHVAGTVAAATDNGAGVAGVAPGVRIMPVRVLGTDGSGTLYDLVQGIRYASGQPNDAGALVAPAEVINLSLGRTGSCTAAEQAAIADARRNGSVVVAAAGNQGEEAASFAPANCPGAIVVGAVDRDGNRARYSNHGAEVDLMAPGGDDTVDADLDGWADGVMSTTGEVRNGATVHTYGVADGTSMAAPHVAGVIALMRSVNPALTADDVDAIIGSGAMSDSATGLVNANDAIVAALRHAGVDPGASLAASVTLLDFGSVYEHAEVEITVAGAGALAVQNVASDAGWLAVTPVAVDEHGIGRYHVRVVRNGLTGGTYEGALTFESTRNTVTVAVRMTVSAVNDGPDAGYLYVVLVDLAAEESVALVTLNAAGGRYDYAFEDVRPGRYEIVAGTDLNHDGFICDAGENCGSYEGPGGSSAIEASNRDLTGLDFTVGAQARGIAMAGAAGADGSTAGTGGPDKSVRR